MYYELKSASHASLTSYLLNLSYRELSTWHMPESTNMVGVIPWTKEFQRHIHDTMYEFNIRHNGWAWRRTKDTYDEFNVIPRTWNELRSITSSCRRLYSSMAYWYLGDVMPKNQANFSPHVSAAAKTGKNNCKRQVQYEADQRLPPTVHFFIWESVPWVWHWVDLYCTD